MSNRPTADFVLLVSACSSSISLENQQCVLQPPLTLGIAQVHGIGLLEQGLGGARDTVGRFLASGR